MNHPADRHHSVSRFLVIAALLQIVWGIVPSASNIVIQQIPVEIYIALRWTISGFIFLVALFLTEDYRQVFRKSSLLVGVLGLFGYGFGSLGTLYGLKIGGVVNFALVSSISPIVMSSVSMLFLKERPNLKFFIALPISVLGSLFILLGKHDLSSWSIAFTSFGLILMACLFEAMVFVFSKRLNHSHSRIGYLAVAQLSAAAGMWLAQISVFHQFSSLSALNAQGWAAALFVSIVACVLCYYVLHWLILHVEGHKLSLFEGLHGISATVFGILFFHDAFNPMMLIGGACVLLGLTIGCWPTQPIRPIE